ncbi:MAG: dephospho-CoA kinase, partial [Desulfobacterales bacterium]|nr:dephospho-CoA kinase [Desulfobacterales bacterium]
APLIDFDVLARWVVEPGRPALKLITEYFGKAILRADGTLDRKKLSGIVFQHPEKRLKLEAFTHKAIFDEYLNEVSRLTAGNPGVIIQAAVPLLMELNLQSMFDHVLVVFVTPVQQVERLVARDGISAAAAADILESQLPIGEKVGRADYVVDNRGTLEETRQQVEAIWKKLQ